MPRRSFPSFPRRHCLAFLLAGLGGVQVQAQAQALVQAHPPDPALTLRSYFSQCHAVTVCNISVLVAQAGRVVHEEAFGEAGGDDQGALSTAHAFDIGSVSNKGDDRRVGAASRAIEAILAGQAYEALEKPAARPQAESR